MHTHFLKSIFGVKTLYSLYFFYKFPKNVWWTFNSIMHHFCAQILSVQIKEMQTKIKKVHFLRQISLGRFMFFFLSHFLVNLNLGPHVLCSISGVVPLTRDLSQAEKEINVITRWKCTKWHLFHSKWSKLSFWVKIVVILSIAQLVTTVIFLR